MGERARALIGRRSRVCAISGKPLLQTCMWSGGKKSSSSVIPKELFLPTPDGLDVMLLALAARRACYVFALDARPLRESVSVRPGSVAGLGTADRLHLLSLRVAQRLCKD